MGSCIYHDGLVGVDEFCMRSKDPPFLNLDPKDKKTNEDSMLHDRYLHISDLLLQNVHLLLFVLD